jgi:hypothetical protein
MRSTKIPTGAKKAERAYKALTLELRPDHTFSGRMFLPIKGTWSIDGDRVTLVPAGDGSKFKIAGQERPVLSVRDDGGGILLVASDKANEQIALRKEAP